MVDLFAGPGGLGEGFSTASDASGDPGFHIVVSIEMDPNAHRTLELRAFYRQFSDKLRPDAYYEYIGNPTPKARDGLFAKYPEQAKAARDEAWLHELSGKTSDQVTTRVRESLSDASQRWVLIGGPPCQAYSLAGRARHTGERGFARDKRHTLYQHYLRLIQDLGPAVFVMENVKGLLSAKRGESSRFDKVLSDLKKAGPGYNIYSLSTHSDGSSKLHPADYVVRSEDYGVPQARHRVILLGVRRDWTATPGILQVIANKITVRQAIEDLPRLGSRVSRRGLARGTTPVPTEVLRDAVAHWEQVDSKTRLIAQAAVDQMVGVASDQPENRVDVVPRPDFLSSWYARDHRNRAVLNHESRAHMSSDLGRYLFCAAFAQAEGRSPKLGDFPKSMLPAHKNLVGGTDKAPFTDRFRVQLASQPSSTVTSHISKDGHYFIHYDPRQCRSLSVREAARLQTFPDDYLFEGNRTQQYHQVGNAVPPLLARQIAEVVLKLF